jgi:hypothetical protein
MSSDVWTKAAILIPALFFLVSLFYMAAGNEIEPSIILKAVTFLGFALFMVVKAPLVLVGGLFEHYRSHLSLAFAGDCQHLGEAAIGSSKVGAAFVGQAVCGPKRGTLVLSAIWSCGRWKLSLRTLN